METSWDLAADDSREFDIGGGSSVELEADHDGGREFETGGTAGAEWSSGEYIEVVGGDVGVYAGPYRVDPSFDERVLGTRGLAMVDDVTVAEIPVYEVSNQYGTTVTIG